MNKGEKNENKLGKTVKTVLYTFIAVMFMIALGDGDISVVIFLAFILLAAGIGALVFHFVKKAFASKAGSGGVNRGFSNHENYQPRKYDSSGVCDRDAQRRLEQLDSFLANGIIDKKEYAELKARYQRYME